MATVKRFEELECWRESRNLVKLIYAMTNKNSFKRDFELVKQIRRSAVSIMANIAEGFHRNSNKDFMRFLDYSRGSIAETLSHCYVALDQNYMNQTELSDLKDAADVVWIKVNNFISYLKRASKKQNKPN